MIAALVLAALAAPARPPVVAVLEMTSKLRGQDSATVDVVYLADRVRTALTAAAPGLRVLTRENMLLLQGQSLPRCEGRCEVEIGRRLGADWVISGEVLRFGTALRLSLELFDVRGGRLAEEAQASGASLEALDAQIAGAAQKLATVILGQPPPVLAPSPAPPPPPRAPAPAAPPSPTATEIELRAAAIVAERDIVFSGSPPANVQQSERALGGGLLIGGALLVAPFTNTREIGFRAGLQLRGEVYRLTTATVVGVATPLQYSTEARVAFALPILVGIDVSPGAVTSFGVAYAPEVFYDVSPATATFVAGRFEAHGDVAALGAAKLRLAASYAGRAGNVPPAATIGLGVVWQ